MRGLGHGQVGGHSSLHHYAGWPVLAPVLAANTADLGDLCKYLVGNPRSGRSGGHHDCEGCWSEDVYSLSLLRLQVVESEV